MINIPHRKLLNNWPYLFWFAFYFIFFSVITGGVAIIFYAVCVPLAFTPLAEYIWRSVSGVRPLRLRSEKQRLLPLFKEVYEGAVQTDPNLSRAIKLYIKEDMSINAFAFGRSTLVLTRGSIALLSDECLKGLIAHEFGHFAQLDTIMALLSTFANFLFSLILSLLEDNKQRVDEASKGLIIGCFKVLYDAVYYMFKFLQFIGDLILMRVSREHEYLADSFALVSGFGQELADVLTEIYSVSVSKPQSVKEQLKSSHPPITIRIEELESYLY